MGKVSNKGLDESDKKGLLKRLKNIEGKNEEQLEATKDYEENQLDAIDKQNKNQLKPAKKQSKPVKQKLLCI